MASRPQDPVAAHLQHLQVRSLSPATLRARREQLARLARFLGVEAGEDLLLASEEDLDGWQQSMVRHSANYRITATAHVREFYRFAVRRGYLDEDPTTLLVTPKQPEQVPHPIPEQDLDTALAFASPRLRPMLFLAAFCGLRAMEIAGLTRERIRDDLDPPVLIVLGKGNKERTVPLPALVLAELRAHGLPSAGPVFTRGDGKPGPATPARVSHLCGDYLHSLGITESLHKLRHYYATTMYAESKDLLLVQRMMGHSSPSTTSGYAAHDRGRAPGRWRHRPSCVGQARPSTPATGAGHRSHHGARHDA